MNNSVLSQINERPIQTVGNLLCAFEKSPSQLFSGQERPIPIGIEIECSWRSYFPDLWMEGFPNNISDEDMQRISEDCLRREQKLLPQLMKAQRAGVPSGADRYWEFAFEPVTDISLLCNQVEILRANGLIPEGHHALHITIGGVEPSPAMYAITMVLEAYACSVERLRSGYGTTGPYQLSKGWAKKGRAGLFMKEGSNDLLHGYEVGTEIRTLHLPKTTNELYFVLDTCQKLVEVSHSLDTRSSYDERCWRMLKKDLVWVLEEAELPNTNWGKPRDNPPLWERIAERFVLMQYLTRKVFSENPLYCPQPN